MKINVALIGVGEQGKTNILPALIQIKNVNVTAVCDIDKVKLKELSGKYGIRKCFDNYKELINTEKLDAIILACPPQIHVEISKYAIQKSIDVFVEKPPAVTLRELKELNNLAGQYKIVNGVGLNFRYADPYKRIKKIIDKYPFGKPQYIEIQHLCNKPTQPLWGLNSTMRSFLLAQAIHPIDLLLTYGDKIKNYSVYFTQTSSNIVIQITILFTNGIVGSILTGTMFPSFESKIKIVSDRSKMITLDSLWNIKLTDTDLENSLVDESKRWQEQWSPSPLNSGYDRSGYYGELEAFTNAVINKTDFHPSFKDEIPVYKIIDMIEEEFNKFKMINKNEATKK